jgi:hypothetical protein
MCGRLGKGVIWDKLDGGMGGQSSIGFLQKFGQPNLPQLLTVATISANYITTHILGIIRKL